MKLLDFMKKLDRYHKQWWQSHPGFTHHLNSCPLRNNKEKIVSRNKRPSKNAKYQSFSFSVIWTTHQTDTMIWQANINLVSNALTISEDEDIDHTGFQMTRLSF